MSTFVRHSIKNKILTFLGSDNNTKTVRKKRRVEKKQNKNKNKKQREHIIKAQFCSVGNACSP